MLGRRSSGCGGHQKGCGPTYALLAFAQATAQPGNALWPSRATLDGATVTCATPQPHRADSDVRPTLGLRALSIVGKRYP
jgi:hypothetical protein